MFDITSTVYYLVGVLAGGTIFAWVQFYLEYKGYCKSCSSGKCSPSVKSNPFFSKCFIGAVFFTISLALAFRLLYGLEGL